MAMNQVYGPVFGVSEAEAADPEAAAERSARLAGQPVLDAQLHFVHPDFDVQALLGLRKYAAEHWNRELDPGRQSFRHLRFQSFLEEVFLQSDTAAGILSGAPADQKENWFLSNDQLARARAVVNATAGSRRLLCHAVIAPGQPGWLEEMDRAAEELKPDAWKGYTVGDPLNPSDYPYRLDDQELMYPAYEKMVKSGITNFCVHKGLVPADPADFPAWEHAKVDDLPRAAKDWPQINFIIYHSALQPLAEYPEAHLERFRRTGRIDWVSDLAEIPARHGVDNVYGEIGTSFASSCLAHPRHAAALVGILVRGLGPEKVLWGTDSVWYGSPQWQLEAFRRMEMPEDLRADHGLPALGGEDSALKRKILAANAARLHGLDPDGLRSAAAGDRLAALRRAPAGEARRGLWDGLEAALAG
jgi:hypothetical protein